VAVTVNPFEPLDAAGREAVAAEIKDVARFEGRTLVGDAARSRANATGIRHGGPRP
jgi:hypothetical protein